MAYDDGGRECSAGSASQGMQAGTRAGGGGEGSPLGSRVRAGCGYLSFRLLNSRTVREEIPIVLSPSRWCFARAAPANERTVPSSPSSDAPASAKALLRKTQTTLTAAFPKLDSNPTLYFSTAPPQGGAHEHQCETPTLSETPHLSMDEGMKEACGTAQPHCPQSPCPLLLQPTHNPPFSLYFVTTS